MWLQISSMRIRDQIPIAKWGAKALSVVGRAKALPLCCWDSQSLTATACRTQTTKGHEGTAKRPQPTTRQHQALPGPQPKSWLLWFQRASLLLSILLLPHNYSGPYGPPFLLLNEWSYKIVTYPIRTWVEDPLVYCVVTENNQNPTHSAG